MLLNHKPYVPIVMPFLISKCYGYIVGTLLEIKILLSKLTFSFLIKIHFSGIWNFNSYIFDILIYQNKNMKF